MTRSNTFHCFTLKKKKSLINPPPTTLLQLSCGVCAPCKKLHPARDASERGGGGGETGSRCRGIRRAVGKWSASSRVKFLSRLKGQRFALPAENVSKAGLDETGTRGGFTLAMPSDVFFLFFFEVSLE